MTMEQTTIGAPAQRAGELSVKIGKTARYYGARAVRLGRALLWKVYGPGAVRPIFVVGCSRGGTTLVYKTFSASVELGSLWRETHDYWSSLHPMEERGWCSHALSAEDARGSDRMDASRFFYVGTGRRRFVDKANQNGLAIPYLHALFPQAHFVYIKRSPGDNINSLMQGWGRADAFGRWAADLPASVAVDGGRYTRWCFFLPPGWRAYLDAPLEDVCAFQYRAMNEAILAARAAIPGAQWSEIRYEDVLADPVAQFRRAFAEAGLRFDSRLQAHCERVLSTPYNAFSEIRKDKWLSSPHAERINKVLPCVAKVAARMGYCDA